jgi:uncharacterized protein with GYD domain
MGEGRHTEYAEHCAEDEGEVDCLAEAALLQVGSAGNIRSSTLRAFNTAEMSGIIGRAG